MHKVSLLFHNLGIDVPILVRSVKSTAPDRSRTSSRHVTKYPRPSCTDLPQLYNFCSDRYHDTPFCCCCTVLEPHYTLLSTMLAPLALDALPTDVLVIMVLCMELKSIVALSKVSARIFNYIQKQLFSLDVRHVACFMILSIARL